MGPGEIRDPQFTRTLVPGVGRAPQLKTQSGNQISLILDQVSRSLRLER